MKYLVRVALLATIVVLAACAPTTAAPTTGDIDPGEGEPLVQLENTTWRLIAINRTEIDDATVRLILSSGQVTGTARCAAYNGFYTLDDNQIAVRDLDVNTDPCLTGAPFDDLEQLEGDYIAALEDAESYRLRGDTLEIDTPGGRLIFQPDAGITDPLLEGVTWELRTIDGQEAIPGQQMQAWLLFNEGRAYGNGGCSSYFGAYDIMEDDLSIRILNGTELQCDSNIQSQQDDLLAALAGAEGYTVDGDMLEIMTAEGPLTFQAVVGQEQ